MSQKVRSHVPRDLIIIQNLLLYSVDPPSNCPGWTFPGTDSSPLIRLQEVTPELTENLVC